MPIKSWIEIETHRVRAVLSGDITTDAILHTISETVNHPDFRAGCDILSDHTGIAAPISTEQVKITNAHMERLSPNFSGSRWAVVTRKEASYGMMRMLAVYLEKVPMTLRVFRSLAKAEE